MKNIIKKLTEVTVFNPITSVSNSISVVHQKSQSLIAEDFDR